MKRESGLIHRIAAPDNVRMAFYKAAKSKWHKADVRIFQDNLDMNLYCIRQMILDGEVHISPYHQFCIYEPKERVITAAEFRDRVLHHALMLVCHERFEKHLIFDTYACRKSKGQHAAIDRANSFARRSGWYLKLDVRKYFDSISHHILSEQLQRLFKEKRLIHIFCRLLDSYHVTPSHGLPIGNLTSQYFANHFLSILDHEIIEKIKPQGFVRYMDDMVIWGSSPNELKVYYKKINEFIEQKLRLKLKAPVINRSTAGLTFLGRRIFTEGVIRWPGEKRRSFRKKVKQAILDHSLGGIGDRSLNMRLLTLFSQLESSKVQGFKINLYNELDHGYEAVTG